MLNTRKTLKQMSSAFIGKKNFILYAIKQKPILHESQKIFPTIKRRECIVLPILFGITSLCYDIYQFLVLLMLSAIIIKLFRESWFEYFKIFLFLAILCTTF